MTEAVISVVNMEVGRGSEVNLPVVLRLVREARERGASVLVLPEMCLQGYADFAFPEDSAGRTDQLIFYKDQAQTIPGPATEAVQEALIGSSMVVQFGLAEATQHGNVIYNSVALVTSDGVIGRYRKTHNRGEYPYFSEGGELPVFDTPVGLVGSLICYDMCFPEAVRALAVQGAELVLMSTAWPMVGHDRADDFYGRALELSIAANAFFNQVWIAASNHCETGAYSNQIDYYGGSQIVSPRGEAVVRSAQDPGQISHSVDVHRDVQLARCKDFFCLNLLQDHRPDLYARYAARG